MLRSLFLDDAGALRVVDQLKQRGHEVAGSGCRDFLFLPRSDDPASADAFYTLMRHYSFRLFLRDVLHFQDDLEPDKLTRFVDRSTVDGYLDAVARLGMVEARGSRYVLPGAPVRNFGPTLEWFVARLVAEEFAIPAVHTVRLKSTDVGGDYDVIGAMDGGLLYVETKSSPPKHIEDREVTVFLQRLADLRPDLAIFLVDTNLRMLDKVVEMFADSLAGGAIAGLSARARRARPERLKREIFHLGRRIFITNSKHEVATNLRDCLLAYHEDRFDLERLLRRRTRPTRLLRGDR